MRLPAIISITAVLAVCGCDRTDPYERQGLWRPTGANDTNLRAMLADPSDLGLGRGAVLSSGDEAAAAVARLRADAVKPLPDSAISAVSVSGAGASQPAAPGAGTPADPVAAPSGTAGAGGGT